MLLYSHISVDSGCSEQEGAWDPGPIPTWIMLHSRTSKTSIRLGPALEQVAWGRGGAFPWRAQHYNVRRR